MFGESLKHLGETASTNDDARVWARENAPHGSVVRADSQTRGRGRLGRNWVSPPNLGLYVSLILRPEIEMAQVAQLTMMAALASVDAVREQTNLRAQVKWPNDIVLHDRKIGGILSEASARETSARETSARETSAGAASGRQTSSIEYSMRVDFVVVGIGLNVNFSAEDLPRDAKLPASSLKMESGDWQSCDALFKYLMFALESRYAQWQNDGWDDLRRQFAGNDFLQDRDVQVETERETYRGRVVGIAEDGTLEVRTASGLRRVVAGDVKWDE